ncbi:kelch-like protein 34 [Megalops cyprinoides]|uniref:kelch-like protein 34 n=1 Tax=Megalops cyprinoides TaxID=118141 RepID=UPI00186532D4|nr:kelch-like protein 34 [Megalops cyprinoides]
MSYFLALSEGHGASVLSRYERLRGEGRLCDVVLEAAGGTRFPAHRALLACASDYFWALFQEHTQERHAHTVRLLQLSAAGLGCVLDFIYTSCLPLSLASLEDVLEAACYLQVVPAVQLCSRYIADNLHPDNCVFLANLAARYGVADALSAANRFVAGRMGALLGHGGDRDGLLELNGDSLREVLAAEDMPGVREGALLRLLLDWLDRRALSSLRSNLLLSRIRFGLVPPGELTRLAAARPALRTPFIRSLLQKALEYHQGGALQPLLQSEGSTLRSRAAQVLLVGGADPEADQPLAQVLTFDPRSRRFRRLTELPRAVQHHCVCTLGNFLFVLGGEEVEVDESGKPAGRAVSGRVWRYDPRFGRWEAAAALAEARARFCCCVAEGAVLAVGGQGGGGRPLDSVEVYNMRADTWRRGVALPAAMHGQACAALGDHVYISGGIHGDRREASREVYRLDPRGGRWEKRAAMSIARTGHQMAAVGGRLYSFLGVYEPFCDIERFDPALNEWTRLRPLLQDRFCYGLAALGGRVLLFGGRKWRDAQEVATPTVLEYDPENDSWRELCKMPAPLSGTQCALMHVLDPEET